MENNSRGAWGSRFGFIMASAGSAIGLGNLWKFPYLAGANGGGAFVLVYLGIVILLGFTMMLGELSIGRATKLNQYGAYKKINPKFGFIGGIGILTGFLILSFYSVVGGWVIKYIFQYIMGGVQQADKMGYFVSFITNPYEPLIWHGLFMAATLFIVLGGVSGGIEKASKIMMPLLFLFLIIIAIRSLTLPGAMEGLKYFLIPNWSKFNLDVLVKAMGQVFFSLSLGMGTLVTYGSYLEGHEDLPSNALTIPALDTMAALLAGIAIMPAVFAFNQEPGAGPGLMFGTLPNIFASLPLGNLFGLMFFVLVFFAAVTSAISLLEVPVSWAMDSLKWSRTKAVWIFAGLCFLIGIGASLSNGPWEQKFYFFSKDGQNFFDVLDYLTSNILLPLGGVFMSLFITFVWGYDNAFKEIKIGSKNNFAIGGFWKMSMMVGVPLMMALVFLQQTGVLAKLIGQ